METQNSFDQVGLKELPRSAEPDFQMHSTKTHKNKKPKKYKMKNLAKTK